MGWTGKILNGVGGFTKIAANGLGDLQRALGRSGNNSHLQLICDIDSNGNPVGAIRPMAKYKSFRNSTLVFSSWNARNTARASARYGLSVPSDFAPNAAGDAKYPSAWTYLPPRYNNTADAKRAEDFIKDTTTATAGYDPNAVAPLAFEINGGNLLTDGESIFLIWKDAGVNTYWVSRSAPGEWWSDRSLSVSEILGSGGSSYNNLYIAFVFYDMTTMASSPNTSVAAIVTNKKFGDIGENAYFIISAPGAVIGSLTYPAITWLNGRQGHTIRVAACLSVTDPSAPQTNAYEVLTTNRYFKSLGFDSRHRTDYVEVEAENSSPINQLVGTLNTGPVLNYVSTTAAGYKKYTVSAAIKGTITAPSSYPASSIWVLVKARVPSGGFYADPTQQGFANEVTAAVQVQVPSNNVTYITLPDVYIYGGAPDQDVIVEATLSETQSGAGRTQAFQNSLTITPNS